MVVHSIGETMPSLGLSMIVRDGGDQLRWCLESVAGLVSQIVIADTGSVDDTVSIAAEFGAEVVDFPSTNDFAAARNAALEPVTTDWVLVLDADEELTAEAVRLIPQLLEAGGLVGGYLLTIRNYLPDLHVQFGSSVSVPNRDDHARGRAGLSWAEHVLCRLFRRMPSIRYEGRVHEVVEYSIGRAGLRIEQAGCQILHFGQLASLEVHARKARFYRELGRAKVAEEPGNAAAWFELGGIELSAFNNQGVALLCLERSVALKPDFADPWILLFYLHDSRGEFEQALGAYRQLCLFSDAIPFGVLQRCGDYLHDRGELEGACACYRKALGAEQMEAVSEASCRVVESKLGYTEVRLGLRSGLAKMQRAVGGVAAGGDAAGGVAVVRENHERLIKGLVLLGDLRAAADAAKLAAGTLADSKFGELAARLRSRVSQDDEGVEGILEGREAARPGRIQRVEEAGVRGGAGGLV